MLAVTRASEIRLREYLRLTHDTTLPRFDVMAALWRRREDCTMTDLSRMLLVSNGNVTAVVDRLEKDGLVMRRPSSTDRRTIHVALTPEGLAQFEGIAAGHEAEVAQIFAGLSDADLDQITDILKRAVKQ